MVGLEPERWRPASIFHLQGAEPQRLFTWSLHLDWLGHSQPEEPGQLNSCTELKLQDSQQPRQKVHDL